MKCQNKFYLDKTMAKIIKNEILIITLDYMRIKIIISLRLMTLTHVFLVFYINIY